MTTLSFAGCGHELCTKCALYLCSTSSSTTEASGPPGSVPCPLCRHGIISFSRLGKSSRSNEVAACSLGGLCASYPMELCDGKRNSPSGNACKTGRNKISPISAETFRAVTCTGFSSLNLPLCTCNKPVGNKSLAITDGGVLADRSAEGVLHDDTINGNVDMHLQSGTSEGEEHPELPHPTGCNFSIPAWRCPMTCQGSWAFFFPDHICHKPKHIYIAFPL